MTNNFILLFLFLFIHFSSYTQSKTIDFLKLSTPEKYWVIFHPFKAKRAFIITKEVLKTTDSILKLNLLGNNINGGQLDAFKHSYWMARLSQTLGEKASLRLGKAHEKGNFRSFKKGKKEDGFLPDHLSSKMDLYNNEVGVKIIKKNPDQSKFEIILTVIDEVKSGSMKILKKDCQGNFLTCAGSIIPKDSLLGKWENKKCLVDSND